MPLPLAGAAKIIENPALDNPEVEEKRNIALVFVRARLEFVYLLGQDATLNN